MSSKVSTAPNITDRLGEIAEIARERRSSLVALARAEGMSGEDAVDCVQEGFCTLLRMARSKELVDDAGEWPAILGGVVRNIARNRRRRHFIARSHAPLNGEEAAHVVPADEIVSRGESCTRLHVCVAELCAIERAVVTLRMLEERPGEDVASALGITRGHVAVLLHRAKRALRECMTA